MVKKIIGIKPETWVLLERLLAMESTHPVICFKEKKIGMARKRRTIRYRILSLASPFSRSTQFSCEIKYQRPT